MRAVDPLPVPPWRRRLRAALAVTAVLAVLAILLGLGTWQLQRKAWKEELIATITERLAAPPAALPPASAWAQMHEVDDEFRRVRLSAVFLNDREAVVYTAGSSLRDAASGPGYEVFAPAQLAGGDVVMVDRGYVPEDRRDPKTRASGQGSEPVEIVGALRWPEPRSIFTPADEPEKNLWFVRDHRAMAAAKGVAAAPFYVAQETPVPPGGWPRPERLVARLPNNHLQYAATWYGLAFAFLCVVTAWFVRRRKAAAQERAMRYRWLGPDFPPQ